MERKLLEVGDKIYSLYGYSEKEIHKIYTVDRVTKTQAISEGKKFKRGISVSNGRVRIHPVKYVSFSANSFYLGSEELKEKHKKQNLLRYICNIKFKDLCISQLENIRDIIDEK